MPLREEAARGRTESKEVVPAKVGCAYSSDSSFDDEGSLHEHVVDVSDRLHKLLEDYLDVFRAMVKIKDPSASFA